MTDEQIPPTPPASAPLAPPVAPGAPSAPPPGYAAYAPNNWGEGLSKVKPLTLWITILLGVNALGSLVGIFTSGATADAAKDYIDGTIDDDKFREEIATNGAGGLLTSISLLALAVVSIIWLFRMIRNHASLGRALRWSPAWAIAGWFLPPLVLYILPFLVLRETWQAADPDSPPGSTSWKTNSKENPFLWVWFVLFGLLPIVFFVVGADGIATMFNNDTDDLAKSFVDNRDLTIVQSIVTILSAGAWFFVVRTLTQRHTQLTGESATR